MLIITLKKKMTFFLRLFENTKQSDIAMVRMQIFDITAQELAMPFVNRMSFENWK